MSALNPVFNALRTLIAATWPEVVADGIYEEEKLDAIPWAELTPPYATIMASDPVATDDWGLQDYWFTVGCKISCVREVGKSGQWEALRQKVEDMVLALNAATLATGQVLSIDAFDYSDKAAPNNVFASKNYSHRAGTITLTLLLYIGPDFP